MVPYHVLAGHREQVGELGALLCHGLHAGDRGVVALDLLSGLHFLDQLGLLHEDGRRARPSTHLDREEACGGPSCLSSHVALAIHLTDIFLACTLCQALCSALSV